MMDISAERTVPSGPPNRRHRSVAEKRRIVEETVAEGASVARIARAHGVNANQVFQWRRLYRTGRLGGTPTMVKLLPVTVEASTAPPASQLAAEPAAGIHIKLGHAQIRIEGTADVALLRVVLKLLRR
jgi:transposase